MIQRTDPTARQGVLSTSPLGDETAGSTREPPTGGPTRKPVMARPGASELASPPSCAHLASHAAGRPKAKLAVVDVLRRELDPKTVELALAKHGSNVVVALFGKQCTGKGTVSSALVARLNGEPTTPEEQAKLDRHIMSGGNTMRRIAREHGYARIEDFVEHLKNNPQLARTIDLTLDLSLVAGVVRGEHTHPETGAPTRVDVYEGRLAGLIGHDARALGRSNVVVVQLDASPREQLLRFINRELGKAHPGIRAQIEPHLADLPSDADFAAARSAVEAITDPALVAVLRPVLQNLDNIIKRDERDRARYLATYGRDVLDPKLYQLTIMTDGKTPAQIVDEILAHVAKRR